MRIAHKTYVMSIDVTRAQSTLSGRVAEEIRVVMTRRRYSGARLAKELGVSAAWVSYRLTGTQPIDLNDLERIAAALGVKVADLFPRADREVTVTSRHPVHISHIDRSGADRPTGRRDHTRPVAHAAPSGPARSAGRTARHRPLTG